MPADAGQEAEAPGAGAPGAEESTPGGDAPEAAGASGDDGAAEAEGAPGDDGAAEAEGASGDGGAPAGDEVDSLRGEVEDYRGRWMRAVADYQNLRRRSAEERSELRSQLLAGLVGGYLGVLDDLDRALGSLDMHEELSGHPWVGGVEMVRQKFAALLKESGVSEIAAEGEPFDPRRHEAIGRQPGPEGVVVAVAERGFEVGSQVVRPARVVVGDGSQAAGGEPAEPGAGAGAGTRG
ncbi:MAG: nucleotide exchange factor GrpE [Chloroflexi bacterium]|nr:nucleotide exchange factor GrpE [Chloroflexota bacterium]